MADRSEAYRIVDPREVGDWHDGTDVPGQFHHLTEALGTTQLAASYVVVPAHTDFERGTAHRHERLEELYLICSGTLTMRCEEDQLELVAPVAIRVAPGTWRSHRNEHGVPVSMWVVSRLIEASDSEKRPGYWDASPRARRSTRERA